MAKVLIELFSYDKELSKLKEEWMVDMAIIFREFDEDTDGKIPPMIAKHIFSIFRLPSDNIFNDEGSITLKDFIYEAGNVRDEIFSSPMKKYKYFFQMIAGIGKKTIDAIDIERFITTSGDSVPLKFCDDFIDEFDRVSLSKDYITFDEFAQFCIKRKIPVYSLFSAFVFDSISSLVFIKT